MSESATPIENPNVKKLTADALDFSQAPFFRNLATIAVGNVRLSDRNAPRIVDGERIEVKPGDAIITMAPNRLSYLPKDEFNARYEVNPADQSHYRSKETGRILWVREPVIFIGAAGKETPVETGGALFRSNIDGIVIPLDKNKVEKDFARLLSDGTLVRLSDSIVAQYAAVLKLSPNDAGHLDDLVSQHRQVLSDAGIRILDTLVGTTNSIAEEVGTLVRQAGAQMVQNADAYAPDFMKTVRGARERVVSWISGQSGGNDPPQPKS